jgi:hypothetical protein
MRPFERLSLSTGRYPELPNVTWDYAVLLTHGTLYVSHEATEAYRLQPFATDVLRGDKLPVPKPRPRSLAYAGNPRLDVVLVAPNEAVDDTVPAVPADVKAPCSVSMRVLTHHGGLLGILRMDRTRDEMEDRVVAAAVDEQRLLRQDPQFSEADLPLDDELSYRDMIRDQYIPDYIIRHLAGTIQGSLTDTGAMWYRVQESRGLATRAVAVGGAMLCAMGSAGVADMIYPLDPDPGTSASIAVAEGVTLAGIILWRGRASLQKYVRETVMRELDIEKVAYERAEQASKDIAYLFSPMGVS